MQTARLSVHRLSSWRTSSFLVLFCAVAVWALGQVAVVTAFVPETITPQSKQTDFTSVIKEPSYVTYYHRRIVPNVNQRNSNNNRNKYSTELYSFMGSDGGILGIGTPEVVSFCLLYYSNWIIAIFWLISKLCSDSFHVLLSSFLTQFCIDNDTFLLFTEI